MDCVFCGDQMMLEFGSSDDGSSGTAWSCPGSSSSLRGGGGDDGPGGGEDARAVHELVVEVVVSFSCFLEWESFSCGKYDVNNEEAAECC